MLTGICDFIHYWDDRKIQFSRKKDDFGSIGSELFCDMEAGYADTIDEII